MAGIKIGSRVRIKGTGEIMYVHANKRGMLFPFYLHRHEMVKPGTPLRGPYDKNMLEIVGEGETEEIKSASELIDNAYGTLAVAACTDGERRVELLRKARADVDRAIEITEGGNGN